MLADVEERLQKLEDIYDRSVSEKNKLELNIERTQSRLNRSDLLVAALSDEQHRWENSLKAFFSILFIIVTAYAVTHFIVADIFSTSVDHSWRHNNSSWKHHLSGAIYGCLS